MNRSTDAYISFLNTNDWSVFRLSQPATWVDPFWPNIQTTGDLSDMLDADTLDAELSGLDVNEAALEDEFTDGSLSGDEDFWFTTDATTSSDTTATKDTSSTTNAMQDLQILKQRELTK